MSNNEDISASLNLDISQYSRNVDKAVRGASDVDKALDDIVDAANKAEKQLNALSGDIDIKLDADISSLDSANRMLQSLDTTVSPVVDINVANEAATRSILDEFAAPLDVPIDLNVTNDATVKSLLDKLTAPLQTKVNIDSGEVDSVGRALAGLDGETVNTKVNADTSELSNVEKQLNALKQLAVIDLAFQVAGGIPDIPLLGTIIEAGKAADNIEAKLGKVAVANAPQYQAQARELYSTGTGASQVESSDILLQTVRTTEDETGKLARTGEDFFNIAERGWYTAQLGGEDYTSVLEAANSMVASGLVPTYEKAFDVLTAGFQNNLNYSDDLLDSVKEYGSIFGELGFTAEEVFSLFERTQESGIFSTDFLADASKEIKIRAGAAQTPGPEQDALKKLGVLDKAAAFVAGDIAGTEYIEALFTSIEEGLASGRIQPQDVVDAVGVKAEDIPIGTLSDLMLGGVSTNFEDVEGTALAAQDALTRGLDSSIVTAQRLIETELADAINKAFDIEGKINQFNDGVKEFSNQIRNGATIPQAIEIAFQIPGFANTVATLESALGNLGITVLQVAANILEGVGQGEAASGIRTTVSDLATQQLTYDLKLADTPEEVANAVTTGVNRGLEASDLQSGILSAGREFISAGELDKAVQLRDMMNEIAAAPIELQAQGGLVGGLMGGVALPDVEKLKASGDVKTAALETASTLDTELAAAEQAITTHYDNMRLGAESKLPGMAEVATSAIPPMQEQFLGLQEQFTNNELAYTTMGTSFTEDTAIIGGTLTTATGYVDGFANNTETQFMETVPVAVDSAEKNLVTFGETVLNTMLTSGEYVQGLIDKLLSIGTLDISMPNIGTGSGAGGGVIPGEAVGGVIPAGEVHRVHGGETLISGGSESVAVLNRQTSSVIDSAIAGYMANANMGGGSVVNNNQVYNVVMNVNGAAAATAAMDSKAVRGF